MGAETKPQHAQIKAQPGPGGLDRHDLTVLRRLAARKAELAGHPLNEERRRLWLELDAGMPGRPLVLAETGGCWQEVLPDSVLECADPRARQA